MSRAGHNVQIPISVLQSVDTLDELEDRLLAHQPRVVEQLRQARKDDLAGKFRPWKPRHVKQPAKSKQQRPDAHPPQLGDWRLMTYHVEIGAQAETQFDRLDATVAASIERKIIQLATNATSVMHRRLVGMPADLEGLCKLRVGDYRVLYWVYHDKKLIRLYRVQHRSEVYRDF